MNVKQLREEFDAVVQGHDRAKIWIAQRFNEACLLAANAVNLPSLLVTADVATVTSGPGVALPANFHRRVQTIIAPENLQECELLPDLSALRHEFGVQLNCTGPVVAACVEGQTLYYQGIPSTPATLKVTYFKKPDMLIKDTDVPVCIPEHLQYDLLVGFAAMRAWKIWEDGTSGATPNTVHFFQMHETAMRALRQYQVQAPDHRRYYRTRRGGPKGWL